MGKEKNHLKSEKEKAGIGRILKTMAPKCWHVAAKWWIAMILADAIYSGISVLIVWLQQRFFDDVVLVIQKDAKIKTAIIALIALGIGRLFEQVLNAFSSFMPDVFYEKVNGKLTYELHEKINKLSPINFEDTKKLDSINKASQGVGNAVNFICRFGYIFAFYGVYIVAMCIYLFTLSKVLALAILFVFVPTVFSQIIRMKVFDKAEDASAPIRRQYDYYEECLVNRDYFKETRLLGAFGYFRKLYLDALDKLQVIKYKASFKSGMVDLCLSIITIFGYAGVLFLLFTSLMNGDISVGAFAAVYASIGNLYDMVDNMMRYSVGEMASEYGTIRNYLNFLDLPEDEGEKYEACDNVSIDLVNVSFAYPSDKGDVSDIASRNFKWDHYGHLIDSDLLKDIEGENTQQKDVVKNVSLHIDAGETIAIVGENGSGKSTIIRLITGLYSPREGKIHYNGEDISKYNLKDLYRKTSAVFQKYQRYQMTLSENIQISNVDESIKNNELGDICTMAGLNVDQESYPDGFDTMLSREFDGVDLSGGQWQRVAIARAFYRKHGLIVLDEPTSAIDPYEETRIYNQFAEISKDKTSIIVTHRLGSVKLADRIVVMKDGEVVEIGAHDDLIKQNGEYARLYLAQEQWYVEAN